MRKKIAVIGSGISGVSAAWYLAKHNHEITIFEKNSYLGGWIGSDIQDNFFFEKGPRSFNTFRSFDLLELIDELKLTSNIIYSSEDAKNRYLYIDNKLQKIPSTFFSLLSSKLTRKYIPTLLSEIFKPKKLVEDETIYSFIQRRFNKDIALKFFDPITIGIYGGDIFRLSVRSCFPDLYNLEREHGSLVKGLFLKKRQKSKKYQSPLFTLKDGISQIAHKIINVENIKTLLSTAVQKIIEEKNSVKIYANDKVFEYDYVVVATPYDSIKSFFYNLPFELGAIEYKSLTTINLGFNSFACLFDGFGYLVPRIANEKVLGVIFDSNIFNEQNREGQLRMTLMIDSDIKKNDLNIFIKNILKRHLNISRFPDYISYLACKNAIPQYHVGYKTKILKLENNFESYFSKIFLTGNYFENVSVSGCIKKSKETVIKIENKIKM